MILFPLMALFALSACTNGSVDTEALGSISVTSALKQGGVPTSDIVVNSGNKHAKFTIDCESDLKSVDVTYDGGTVWLHAAVASCSNGAANVDMVVPDTVTTATGPVTSDVSPAQLRLVLERGYSAPITMQFIRGGADVSQQSVTGPTNGYTNSLRVPLGLHSKFRIGSGAYYDASEVKISTSAGCSGGTWQPFATSLNVDLQNVNTTNPLSVMFRDAGENLSQCLNLTIVHDATPPIALTFAIPQVPAVVATSTVDFNISAGGDPFEMKISNDSACASGFVWEPYATIRSGWAVPNQNAVNFASVQFRDRAGNMTACLPTTYTHDTLPPPIPSVGLLFGTSPSQSASPVIKVAGLANGDLVRVFRDASCFTEIAQGFANAGEFYLNPTMPAEGTFPISTIVRDAAGNTSMCQSSLFTYVYDATPPVADSTGHPLGTSNVLTWTEQFDAINDITAMSYKIGGTGTDCSSVTGYSAYAAVPFNVNMDITSLPDGSIKLCVLAKDGANNVQSFSSPTIYAWTKNTSAVVATLLSPPALTTISNTISSSVTTAGGLTDYRYKVGPFASTDCSVDVSYSSWIARSAGLFLDTSSIPDGNVKLCMVGRNAVPVEQPVSAATIYSWAKDTHGPSIASITIPPAGTYYAFDRYTVRVTFDEPMKIGTGTMCTFRTWWGTAQRDLNFASQIDSTTFEFFGFLQPGDAGSFQNGTLVGATNCFTDLIGNSSNFSLSANTTPSVTGTGYELAVGFDPADTSAFENAGTINLPLKIPAAVDTNIDVEYFVDGTAQAGVDYVAPSGTATIPQGSTSVNVPLTLIDNGIADGDRSVVLQLRSVSRGTMKSSNVATVRIRDNEGYVATGSPRKVSTGTNHACWMTSDGSVKCLGANNVGQLGQADLGMTVSYVTASKVPISGVVDISSNNDTNCAVLSSGNVNCWGYNSSYGLLGNGTTSNSPTPVIVVDNISFNPITNVKSVQLYYNTAYALLYDGTMRTWGNNNYGTIGNGGTANATRATNPGLSGVSDLYIGSGTSSTVPRVCAVGEFDANPANGKEIKCWGYNNATVGITGTGSVANYVATPTLLPIANVAQLTTLNNTTSVRTVDGKLYTWGDGVVGILGNGTTTSATSPQLAISSGVMTMQYFSSATTACALVDANMNLADGGGTVKCWGNNTSGYVGQGNTTSPYTTPTAISSLSNVMSLSVGGISACAITDADLDPANGGALSCWGSNGSGQIGDGTTSFRTSPVTIFAGGVQSVQVSVNTACAILIGGAVKCWGQNFGLSPVVVTGLPSDLQSLTLRPNSANGKICGTRANGDLICSDQPTVPVLSQTANCVFRTTGMTCDSSLVASYSPTVPAWTKMFSGVTKGAGRSITERQCLAIGSNWYCGGDNGSATLLQKTTLSYDGLVKMPIPSSQPIDVGPSTGCTSPGSNTLSCWGHPNSSGTTYAGLLLEAISTVTDVLKFVVNTSTSVGGFYLTSAGDLKTFYSSTRAVLASNVVDFSANASYSCIVDTSGLVKCKGSNGVGQIGDGTTTTASVYTQASGVAGADRVWTSESGSAKTCARIASSKALWCWGYGMLVTPQALPDATANVEDVMMNNTEMCVRFTNGDLKCGVGNPLTTSLTGVVQAWPVTTVSLSKCALKTNGDVYCMGGAPSTFGRLYDQLPRFYP